MHAGIAGVGFYRQGSSKNRAPKGTLGIQKLHDDYGVLTCGLIGYILRTPIYPRVP